MRGGGGNSVVGGGGGYSSYRGEEGVISSTDGIFEVEDIACVWLTEESFWSLRRSATPHCSRQTALGQNSKNS